MIDFDECVQVAARYAVRKFAAYIDYEDMISIGWVYLLEHEAKVIKWREMEEEHYARWQLNRELNGVMDRYSRKERAAKLGYEVGDEAFYNKALISKLLPFVLNGDQVQPVIEKPEISSGRDPSEGGDWLVSWIDVDQAWSKAPLTATERELIVLTYLEGAPQDVIGEALGLSQSGVSRGHQRALKKLSDALGGSRSTGCPFDCQCHEGKLRVRP